MTTYKSARIVLAASSQPSTPRIAKCAAPAPSARRTALCSAPAVSLASRRRPTKHDARRACPANTQHQMEPPPVRPARADQRAVQAQPPATLVKREKLQTERRAYVHSVRRVNSAQLVQRAVITASLVNGARMAQLLARNAMPADHPDTATASASTAMRVHLRPRSEQSCAPRVSPAHSAALAPQRVAPVPQPTAFGAMMER